MSSHLEMTSEIMKQALLAADKPKGSVLPNPRVGAALLYRGEMIAEGYHRGPGKAHGERDAIQKAQRLGFRDFKNSELFITLEPCVHTNKRTAPCCPLLIEKKFKKIHIALKDPNPQVCGKGIQALRAAGLKVELGLMKKEAQALNQAFIKNQSLQQTYVSAKIAMSFDGKMALDNGQSKWITSEKSRKEVRQLRARHQFIGVGKNTVERDDPRLNIRLGDKKSAPSRVIVFGKPKNWKRAQLHKLNSEVRLVEKDHKHLLSKLYEEGVCEILLEGGPRLFSTWLKRGWVDRLHMYLGRGFMGGSGRYSPGFDWALKSLDESVSFQPESSHLVGSDVRIIGNLNVYRTR